MADRGVRASSKMLDMSGEKITYKRYYLGWEAGSKKVVICIYPNGDVQIEE